MKFRRLRFQSILIFSFIAVSGCVAPGSSFGLISIEGTLVSATNKPIPDRDIQFILPAAYGLGGLDLVMNDPEDFGHKDEKFSVTTDSSGNFHYEIGKRVYHISCWLLPPVGCYPKRPPAPFLLVQLPKSPIEYYAIETYKGEFKVYSFEGAEIPLSDSNILELSAHNEPGTNPEVRETVGKIKLRLKSE